MDNFQLIKDKLEQFIKKYYVNELIRGLLLFFAIGVLYFIVTLLVEYFLWLSSLGRTILFWSFIVVEATLFLKFICIPLTRLFKLTKGIDYKKASGIIGDHFPEVNDKLLNLLQLKDSGVSSSLLIAGIEQKSELLKPIPFKLAINLKSNTKYLKFAIIPVLLFLFLSVVFKGNWFSESYDRVINYDVAYLPPAPFEFVILNQDLDALESKDFVLQVKSKGDMIPENASITYNNEIYFLKSMGSGKFQYTFVQPKESLEFILSANDVYTNPFILSVVPVPSLLNFEMKLDYPQYTKKQDDVLKSSGNAIIPEGTKVNWVVHTRNTEKVDIRTRDTLMTFTKKDNRFSFYKSVFSNLDYEISTSNNNVNNHDNLAFTLKVIKDQYPELNIKSVKDSVDNHTLYFYGRASDDYGLSSLRVVYYDTKNPEVQNHVKLKINNAVVDEFVYVFPNNISLNEGVNYEFYFEVFDNDVIHNYKRTRSRAFNYRMFTEKEREEKRLEEQSKSISGLNKTLEKFKEQQKDLDDLSRLQKEKKRLDFNDKKKLQDFLERQKKQEKLMKDFSKRLKDNLDQFEKKDKEEPFKDALKERLERNQLKLEKNKKMLEELEKLADKINKEELTEKLEELSKENKSLKKNLEQLLELTKRFYVVEKHEKLAAFLEDLAKKQEELSEKNEEENNKEEQEKLNKEFDKFKKQLEELKEQNNKLKKPMDIAGDKHKEEEISAEQKKASDDLEKQNKKEAKKSQKSAAQKMKDLSMKMQNQMQTSGEEQQQEDMDMLRQILDNLVFFSIEQESLMNSFNRMEPESPDYVSKLKRQSVLRENFLHIDDSLYALALRTPQVTEQVTDKLGEIEFNIEKALEQLAENLIIQGTSNQQYTITSANDLAYLLSQALDKMQNSMPSSGKGKGKGKGFQLPDIIKKQEELNDKMKKGAEKGKESGEGKEGKKKDGGKESGDGKEGEKKAGGKKNGKGKGKDSKEGGDSGKDGNGKNGKSQQQGEDLNGELYEIYKEQQQLRKALEDKIKGAGLGRREGNSLLKKMEGVEKELLERGFNDNTLRKMLDLKHELLKLDEATFEQGKEEKRQSKTNISEFQRSNQEKINTAKQYFNTTEILNRQALPLQQNHKIKVQEYFKKEND